MRYKLSEGTTIVRYFNHCWSKFVTTRNAYYRDWELESLDGVEIVKQILEVTHQVKLDGNWWVAFNIKDLEKLK